MFWVHSTAVSYTHLDVYKRQLQQWLEDNAFAFSQAEQNYLVQQYQALETPMYVDYTTCLLYTSRCV